MNFKVTLIILFSLIYSSSSFSQNYNEYFDKAERYYELQQYELALEFYLKYYPADSTNAILNERIGDLYLITNIDKSLAIIYLIRSKAALGEASLNLQLKIAKAYFYDYRFNKAIDVLTEINMQSRTKKNMNYIQKAGFFLQQVLSADALYSDTVQAQFTHLGDSVNNKYANFNPYITEDDNTLYFSSRNKKNVANIYRSKFDTTKNYWRRAHKLKKISSIYDDILAGVQPSGSHILIHFGEASPITDINICNYNNSSFSEPVDIGKFVSSDRKEEGAFLTNSGDTLYFSSARNGGYGGLDLYMSIKLPDGKWGLPINLGDKINSNRDENYPFLMPDGKKLFYSSTGFNTMGGYDLFYSIKDSLNQWTYPTNLGFPINDVYDNKTISFAKNRRYAYAAYVKPNTGKGNLDLYRIIFTQREAKFLTFIGIVYYTQNHEKKPITELSTDISVTVHNRNTEELVGTYAVNEKSGKLVIALLPGEYNLKIEGDAYQSYSEKITIEDKDRKNNIIKKDFILKLKR